MHFSTSKLTILFRDTRKHLNKNVWSNFLVQNFTRFLVDSFIFALILVLRVKNSNKVDTSEIKCFWSKDFQWVHFVSVFHPLNETCSKIRSPPETWLNSEQESCLQHFYADFLCVSENNLKVWRGKVWFFNLFWWNLLFSQIFGYISNEI